MHHLSKLAQKGGNSPNNKSSGRNKATITVRRSRGIVRAEREGAVGERGQPESGHSEQQPHPSTGDWAAPRRPVRLSAPVRHGTSAIGSQRHCNAQRSSPPMHLLITVYSPRTVHRTCAALPSPAAAAAFAGTRRRSPIGTRPVALFRRPRRRRICRPRPRPRIASMLCSAAAHLAPNSISFPAHLYRR